MEADNNIKLAFYGDDFTGSTDALEFLSRAGARTVLFLDNPSRDQIRRFGDPEAIGVAGMTRTMEPAAMAETLREAFASLQSLRPTHVHYKVCSTFDSSPETGNIGTAIETGLEVFRNPFTPVLVAAPHLGRYAAFGNLFARMGIGSRGAIHRLDRHPSMRAHPVTPATESDLRLHLARQTGLPIGLVDLTDLEAGPNALIDKLNGEIAAGKKIIFFDAMYDRQMIHIGEVFDQLARELHPLFSVGSSGIEKALGDLWKAEGQLQERNQWESLQKVEPMLVLSGSVSPITADQIEWALQRGFAEVAVELAALEAADPEPFIAHYRDQILDQLRRNKSVILHTAKGPDDPRIAQIRDFLARQDWNETQKRAYTALRFGQLLGRSARAALAQSPVDRLVIAGGDTSSFVARELGIEAVEMIAPAFPGAPVCRAYATGSPVDGIEVNIKGGQVGDATYFETLKNGKI
ncbi:four-carbon acid sugar kinase family protein [Flavilitoribacter nigricans]|uniref:Serine kinase n=1 Tax=Flavilitoribacter nigricans (strain ATCC 23147 / DSM 23189 / NBRC 102662 / NCIMB 1420 / SS-2) TaxID=1122177 RepID=A0A2D0N212_FLAN2|nr:four-carbon acid sugar kinase family protein [Flavilitoribacter nigricans]PHN02426.1 serine kinase [Flavilitoribacter nigricans DSM 23189 = NBRC 102662]